jgi:hypothetical protein
MNWVSSYSPWGRYWARGRTPFNFLVQHHSRKNFSKTGSVIQAIQKAAGESFWPLIRNTTPTRFKAPAVSLGYWLPRMFTREGFQGNRKLLQGVRPTVIVYPVQYRIGI